MRGERERLQIREIRSGCTMIGFARGHSIKVARKCESMCKLTADIFFLHFLFSRQNLLFVIFQSTSA